MEIRTRTVVLILILFISRTHGGCHQTGNGRPCPRECLCTEGDSVVNCRGQGLEAIPPLPPKTTAVFLNENKIKTIDRKDFLDCVDLVTVDLSNNSLQAVDSRSFEGLTKLQVLYLHNNFLQLQATNNSFPLGTLDPCTSLIELKMHGNMWEKLTGYPYDVVRHKRRLRLLTIDAPKRDIPLPDTFSSLVALKTLNLHGGLTVLRNDTLAALTNIAVEEIGLLSGTIESLDVMSLSHLQSMTSLDLSRNTDLGLGRSLYQAWYGLPKTNIRKLFLRNLVNTYDTKPSTLGTDFFQYLNNTNLQELYLDANGISRISASLSRHLPNLQKLSLPYNMFSTYLSPLSMDLFQMLELRYIDLSYHKQFPIGPLHLPTRDVGGAGGIVVNFFLPPKLSVLNVSNSFALVHWDVKELICHSLMTDVDILDFSQNSFSALRQPLKINPPHPVHVKLLNITRCNMDYMTIDFLPPTFKLDTIDYSDNIIGEYITKDVNGSMMIQFNSASLKEVYFMDIELKQLPPKFFQNIYSLEKIHLDGNSLRSWNSSLRHMKNLTLIDLSGNLLSWLEQATCDELDQIAEDHIVSLDLLENPLDCQCYTLNFLKWLETTKVKILNRDLYTCQYDGYLKHFSNLTDIVHDITIACYSKTWVTVSGVSLTILVIMLVVSVPMYRYRWDIKYAYLKLVRQRKHDESLRNPRHYEFDAFVAYHKEDLAWVAHMLIPHLEEDTDPLKLCVHHRNWLPGPTIEENISKSVEASRRTLVVLTKDFNRSGWCELELQLARIRGLNEGEEIIVVVALEHIPMRRMSTTLVNLRRTNTWLDWYEYEQDREQFWELLRKALKKPSFINRQRSLDETASSDHEPLLPAHSFFIT